MYFNLIFFNKEKKTCYYQTVNIYNKRQSANQAYVNNQITDWSFKVDGILHNVPQANVYDQVVKDITNKTLDGYNGQNFSNKKVNRTQFKIYLFFHYRNCIMLWPNWCW